ncbi:MAG: hypothetical protein ACOH2S_01480 [Janthinobacterium svalbardensis]
MASVFNIVITAVDRATRTVRSINDTFARLTRPLVLIRQSVQNLSNELGLDKVAKAMGGVGRSALDVAGRVRSIVAPMAAVIGVGSIAGLLALAISWGTVGMEVSKAGAAIGMSTSTLMSMRGAAKLAGVTAEELTGSLKSVGDTMEDALFGRNQSALMLLNKMRIGIHKTADGSIDAARGFKDIATYISGIKSAQVQGVIARQFGIEAALPLLRKGAKGIEEYQQKVAEFGGSRTAGAIAAAEQFGFKMVSLSMATDGVKISIGERLIPVLQPFIEKLITWVTVNRELIATRVTEFVAAFATWIERINFNDVLNGMTSFISGVAGVIDSLGGWKTAALLVMGVMAGPFLLSVATFGASLVRLGVTVIPVFIRALGLMRLAMLANPITAIVMAIATVALFLYENWDKVKKWWKGLWGDMSDDAAKSQSAIAKTTEKLAKGTKGLGEKQTGGASGDWGDRRGGGASGDWEDASGTRSRAPRGIRNNNPGNLRSWGDMPREDGFARFPTPEAGLAAMIKNLQVQQSKHGLNTIAGIIGRWAPPNENDTAGYVGNISKQTGFGPHQPLDLTDKSTVAPLISSMIRQEGNSAGYSKDMVEKAVTQVVVDFKNAPAGTTATANMKGGNMVPVRVNHSMPTLAAG